MFILISIISTGYSIYHNKLHGDEMENIEWLAFIFRYGYFRNQS